MTPEQMLKNTTAYYESLEKAKKMHVAVGLPLDKVGQKIYGDGMTIFQIGAVHEYGATINHPGGTKYIMKGGKTQFVSNDYSGPVAGTTGPHTITIPQRSFLRVPFATKKAEIADFIVREFKAVAEQGRSPEQALGRVGLMTTNISKKAFTSRGYGQWPDIAASTKKRKGSGQPLIDTGTLRRSVTHVVRTE